MGHAFRRCSSKIKVKKSELAKKNCSFLDYFFFNRSLKLVAFAFILTLTTVYLRSKIYDVDIPMYTLFTKFHF